MWILFLLLKDESRIRTLVGILIEMELFDSSVLDGEGIENLGVRSLPVLSEVAALFGQSLAYHRVLCISLDDKEQARTLVVQCRKDGLDLLNPETAMMRLIPCEPVPEVPDAG